MSEIDILKKKFRLTYDWINMPLAVLIMCKEKWGLEIETESQFNKLSPMQKELVYSVCDKMIPKEKT
jgi:hypothetical protein